ncbi:MAG: AAA family ATPase [Pseudonocardiaceae bacterium]
MIELAGLVPRHAESPVTEALADTRVVLVNGARQAGKSTLTRLAASRQPGPVIRLLDDPATLQAAKDDPTGFVDHQGLMVIDEIQLVPELLRPIKVAVDLDPTPGRFLLAGSSRILALRTLPDAQPGRMEVIELWPFSQGEISGEPDRFVDAAFRRGPRIQHSSTLRRRDYLDRIVAGGFPEAVRRTPRRRTAFFDSYLSTLIERDVLELATIERRGDLLTLLALLAGRAGGLQPRQRRASTDAGDPLWHPHRVLPERDRRRPSGSRFGGHPIVPGSCGDRECADADARSVRVSDAVMSSEDLVVGALVRWATAPGSPIGVIQEVDGPRIRIRFDGETESKVFNAHAQAVERVELPGMVKRASTGSIGLLHGRTTATPPRWQVILDGNLVTVAEADLRPHLLDDPLNRLRQGRLGSARQFSLAVNARRYEIEQLINDLVSLGESRVDIKPHQVSVVHRVVTNYPHRFLLCDEVGLGKTIEAGMILKELRARGAAGRCLIIAPPNLVRQWQFELKSKFNETFSILNGDTVKYLQATHGIHGNPFEVYDSVIVSSSWIAQPRWAQLASETSWDVVILDEAHHVRVRVSGAKREETRLYKVVRQLASPEAFSKRAALFLTATPMQLDSRELYSLVEILDPALFPTVEHFDQHRRQVPGLSRLVHDLTEHGFPLPDQEPASVIERVASWLDIDQVATEQRLKGGWRLHRARVRGAVGSASPV